MFRNVGIKMPENAQKKEHNIITFFIYTSISSGEGHGSSLSDINSFFSSDLNFNEWQ